MHCGLSPFQEVNTEPGALEFIVPGRIKHLDFGGTKKANGLHRIAVRASRKTSSADRAGILPLLYSW